MSTPRSFRPFIACVIAAGLLAPLPVLAAHHGDVRHERTTLGEWRLDIARDPFSGGIACRLRSGDHKAFYRADAVGFRFAKRWDVAQAIYRLDGGEPRTERDDLPELIAHGVPLDRGGMANASGGVVWVPFETLRQANMIAIAPRPDRRAVTLHFRGLIALHDIAVERGCSPESSFVE